MHSQPQDPFLLLKDLLQALFHEKEVFFISLPYLRDQVLLLAEAFPFFHPEIHIVQHTLCNIDHLFHNQQDKSFQIQEFSVSLASYLKQLFFLLEPLILEGKNHGALLFFLLTHHEEISFLTHEKYLALLLKKLHPEGWDSMHPPILDHLEEKGLIELLSHAKILQKMIFEKISF